LRAFTTRGLARDAGAPAADGAPCTWPRSIPRGPGPRHHDNSGEGDNVERYDESEEQLGIVVFRWEAPQFFADCSSFRTQVRQIARERQPTWIVLQCEAITDLDVSAADMLEKLDRELNDAGTHLAFVEMRHRLQGLVQRYGLYETLDRDCVYPTLDAALEAIGEA
jgi:MFS superfamily sulfate permease-like transporter